MKNPICILLLAATFLSCKKDKQKTIEEETIQTTNTTQITPQQYVDTIKPGSYFPVYPGSWFKYKKQDSTVFTNTASATYLPLPIKITNSNTTSYVPYLNYRAIVGYQTLRYPPSVMKVDPSLFTFLPMAQGDYSLNVSTSECDYRRVYGYPSYCEEVYLKNIQKAVNAAGDSMIIATEHLMRTTLSGPGLIWEHRYTEYTKNIGLTHYYRIADYVYHQDTLVYEPDTIETWRLIDYHIGPH